jgi:hypothetical protein
MFERDFPRKKYKFWLLLSLLRGLDHQHKFDIGLTGTLWSNSDWDSDSKVED